MKNNNISISTRRGRLHVLSQQKGSMMMDYHSFIRPSIFFSILFILGINIVTCEVSPDSSTIEVNNHVVLIMTDEVTRKSSAAALEEGPLRMKRTLAFGPNRDQGNNDEGSSYNRSSSGSSSRGGYFGHGSSNGDGSGSGSSNGNGGSSSSPYGSYGGSPSSSSSYSYGSPSYGSSTSSRGSSPSSHGSYGSYGGSSSYSGSHRSPSGSSSSSSYGSYNSSSKYQHEEPMIPLAWVILLIIASVGIGMLITANEFISNSEGNWANFCRLSVSILDCLWKIIYNCYHCRLSEIPNVVWAGEEDDDIEAYTEQELQNMKPRPGIERALDVEHKRSMNRLKKEFGKKKTALGNKIAKKVGVIERGPGLVALLGERKTYLQVNTEEPTDGL